MAEILFRWRSYGSLFCRSQRLTADCVTPTLSANVFCVSGGRLSSITFLRRLANLRVVASRRDFTLYARLPVIPCLCRSDSFPLARCWSTLFASARVRVERPLFRHPGGTVSPRRNRCRSCRARRSFRRSFHHRLVPEGCGKIKKRRP